MRAGHRQLLLRAVDYGGASDGEIAGAGGLGLEGENADYACAGDAVSSRRTRHADDQIARGLVSVDGGSGLTVTAEEAAGGDIDELQFCRIVVELQRDGRDVRPPFSTTGTWKVAPEAGGVGGGLSAKAAPPVGAVIAGGCVDAAGETAGETVGGG